ncbi:hypothetical protein [Mycolicibacterium sp. XJ879]
MQVAVRSTVTTGVALIGAGVIAVAPVAPPVPEIAATPIYSPPVALTATYAELFDNTLSSLGYLGNDLFEEGIAPILQQVAVNQLTMVQDLGAAIHRLFEASNPVGIPATFRTAIDQLAAGQIQQAAETLSTGVILAALPLLPPLQVPINNLVAVIDLIPQVIPMVGIGLISPPLSLFQATAEAVQDVVDAVGAGDFTGVVNAFINAPATILNGVINGYPENGFPGLIGPSGGALGVIVDIRDMILGAITPDTANEAEETEATPETAAVTATTTSPALTVNLDVEAAFPAAEVQAASTSTATTGGDDRGGETPATDATEEADDAEDAGKEEAAEEDDTTESAVDEEVNVENPTAEEETESDNGQTDLSDGNKVSPGDTAGDDADTESADSGDAAESDTAESDADTDSDSGDGSDSE